MVMCDEGLPDPPDNSEKTLSTNGNVYIAEDSTESDEEQVSVQALGGYQPLPLSPEDANDSTDNEHQLQDCTENQTSEQTIQGTDLPSTSTVEVEVVKEVWSAPPPAEADIKMDSKKIDEVKRVMLNVTLPPSAIPDWAKTIPEEQWKQHLLSKLQTLEK